MNNNTRVENSLLVSTMYLPILLMCLIVTLFNSCRSKDELVALSKCEFRVKNANNITLAGIAIDNVETFSDLGIADGLTLLAAAASDNLPMSLIVNVEVMNPNSDRAALNKAEWILYVDDLLITTGTYEERIEIPANGGMAIMSVPVSVNLKKLLEGETGLALLNLAFNLADIGEEPSRITLSVKPYIYIGRRLISYPGFFDIRTEFTSGDE